MIGSLLFAASIAVPQVQDHTTPLPKSAVVEVCEQRVAADNLPCAVVEIDERVCFAFLDVRGESSTVHCFPLLEVET